LAIRRCFKCQGFGHRALDCPNHRIIISAEWEAVKEEENEKEKKVYLAEGQEENLEEVEERTNKGEILILRKALSGSREIKISIERTFFTIRGKVCSLVIDR